MTARPTIIAAGHTAEEESEAARLLENRMARFPAFRDRRRDGPRYFWTLPAEPAAPTPNP